MPGRFIDGLQDPSGSLFELISQTNDPTPPKDASAERLQSDYAAAEKHSKMLGTHFINREWMRCWRFGAAARREEGEYPLWIFERLATPLQWQRCATLRAKLWQAAGRVAPQSQSASAMLLRRALPAARQSLAHSFPINGMSSNGLRRSLPEQ